MASQSTIVGVFEDQTQAQTAVKELKRRGFTEDQIGVVGRHYEAGSAGATRKLTDDKDDTYAGEGVAAGLATGAGVGALWGLGILAGALPAIGPAIAGGTLAALLSSAAAGAATAGLAGGLVGLGIPKEEADYYESEFRSGRTIVTVNALGREADVREVFNTYGAYDVSRRGGVAGTTTGTTRMRGEAPPAVGEQAAWAEAHDDTIRR
ncbi:MAG: general stress protein [Planctomycetaceae bacterium]